MLLLAHVLPGAARANADAESILSGGILVGAPVISSGAGTFGYSSGIVPLAIGGFVGGGLTTTGYAALYFLLVRSTRNSAVLGRESSDQSAHGQTSGGSGRGRYADAMERLEILRGHQEEALALLAQGGDPGTASLELRGLMAEVRMSADRCSRTKEGGMESRKALMVLATTQWDEALLQRLNRMPDFGEVESCAL